MIGSWQAWTCFLEDWQSVGIVCLWIDPCRRLDEASSVLAEHALGWACRPSWCPVVCFGMTDWCQWMSIDWTLRATGASSRHVNHFMCAWEQNADADFLLIASCQMHVSCFCAFLHVLQLLSENDRLRSCVMPRGNKRLLKLASESDQGQMGLIVTSAKRKCCYVCFCWRRTCAAWGFFDRLGMLGL